MLTPLSRLTSRSCNQGQSRAIKGNQWRSRAFKDNQGQSREIAPGMEHVCTSLQDWGDTRLATAIAAASTAAAAAAVAAAAAHYILERGAIRRMDLSNSEGAIEAPRDAISHRAAISHRDAISPRAAISLRDAISPRQLVQRELLCEMGAQLGEVKCLLIICTHTLRPAEAYSGLQRSAVVSSQLWQPAIIRAHMSSSEILLRAPPRSFSELLRAPPSPRQSQGTPGASRAAASRA